MEGWQATYLGMRELPRELSAFELRAFFTFSRTERDVIKARRNDALKLALALHIGFLRMSGRLLDGVRIVPPALWRHLGAELGIEAPQIASLRAMYGRGRTLFDHQQVACEALGFRWMSEHQRRALVRLLSDEVLRCADRAQLLGFAPRWALRAPAADRARSSNPRSDCRGPRPARSPDRRGYPALPITTAPFLDNLKNPHGPRCWPRSKRRSVPGLHFAF